MKEMSPWDGMRGGGRAAWNQGNEPLRQCSQVDPMTDQIEFNWGYETPERKRIYTEYDQRWDQIDVRMHFFHNQMIKTEWQKAANGMWFIQDYVDFMGMIQQLPVINDTTSGWRSQRCRRRNNRRFRG